MINALDIMLKLNVTEQQVIMAIYSGRLPRPNEDGGWYEQEIQIYLDLWEKGLISKRKQIARNTSVSISKFEFPAHTR